MNENFVNTPQTPVTFKRSSGKSISDARWLSHSKSHSDKTAKFIFAEATDGIFGMVFKQDFDMALLVRQAMSEPVRLRRRIGLKLIPMRRIGSPARPSKRRCRWKDLGGNEVVDRVDERRNSEN